MMRTLDAATVKRLLERADTLSRMIADDENGEVLAVVAMAAVQDDALRGLALALILREADRIRQTDEALQREEAQ